MKWIKNILNHFEHLQPSEPEISDLSFDWHKNSNSRLRLHTGRRFANISLLTKQSVVEYKSRWKLFLFFLLFLILSMGIIVGLIHFTYSFGHEAKKFSTLDRVGLSTTKTVKLDQEDILPDGEFANWAKKNFQLDISSDLLKDILKNEGNITPDQSNNSTNSRNVKNDESERQKLYDETGDYFHNLMAKWYYEEAFKNFSLNDYPEFDFYAQLGAPGMPGATYQGKELNVDMFYSKKKYKGLPDWQVRKDNGESIYRVDEAVKGFDPAFYGDDDSFKNAEDNNDIIVTPTFLSTHNLKLKDTITILIDGVAYKERIMATALRPGQVVSDKSNNIELNPSQYDKILNTRKLPWGPYVTIFCNQIKDDSDSANAIMSSCYNQIKEKLSKSFTENTVSSMIGKETYARTTVNSYHVEMLLYNIFSWVVTAILIILLIVAYRFVQSLVIRANKGVLINLKATGVNAGEIGYYLGISFLPVLAIGSAVGLGVGELIYYLFSRTLGTSVGFDLSVGPSSALGYIIFCAIFVGLVIITGLIAYMSTRGKELSIHSKAKINGFKLLLLKIKGFRLIKNSGFGNVVYSFQIDNLLKAFSTFIVTTLSLTVLGVSLQFICSISQSLENKSSIYMNSGESLSWREYKDGQIQDSGKPIDQYTELKSDKKLPLKKVKNPYKTLINWAEGFVNKDKKQKLYYDYFAQVYDLDKFYKMNRKRFMQDAKGQSIINPRDPSKPIKGEQVVDALDQMDQLVNTYVSQFGKEAPAPKLFFKYRPKTEDYLGSAEIHYGKIEGDDSDVRIYNASDDHVSLDANQIIINSYIAKSYGLSVGDTVHLRFDGVPDLASKMTNVAPGNHVSNQTLKNMVVKAVDPKLYYGNEAVVNFDAIRKSLSKSDYVYNASGNYKNTIISKSTIPYDIENYVLPVGEGDNKPLSGESFWDYFPDVFNSGVVTNMGVTSIPIMKTFFMNRTAMFRQFATLVSILLVLVSLCIVCVISILIAYENKKNVLVVKSLGYSLGRSLSLFATIYAIAVVVGFVASIFIGGALLDTFTGTLVQRLFLSITHVYSAETILIPFAIAFVFLATIVATISSTYKKTAVDEITFAE